MSSTTEQSRPTASGFDTRIIAVAGMMMALVFVLTWWAKIPVLTGYVHLGDAAIYAASFLFGPIVGLFAAAFGTAFADLAAGYGSWAPASFVVHGLQGLVAGYMAWRRGLTAMIAAVVVGGAIVVGGYFLYQWLIVREGLGPASAAVGPNILQVVVGGVLGIALVLAVRRAYPPVATFGQPTVWEDSGPR
jgi:energy-coupling factor transport system substrate-specific component